MIDLKTLWTKYLMRERKKIILMGEFNKKKNEMY